MTFEASQTETSAAPGAALNDYTGASSMPSPSAQEKKPARAADTRQARVAQAFSQIVAVLMRDPVYKNLKIADLEHLVLPPVLVGQFRLALGTRKSDADYEQKGGIYVPVAVALWARVSPGIDKALSENLDKPVWLRPQEWTSGDVLWLMAAAGNPRAIPEFLKQLAEKDFKGKTVKMRLRGADGKAIVQVLGQAGA